MDPIKKNAKRAKIAFFLSAAAAFVGLGLYLIGYVLPGVLVFILGLSGIIISFAVLRVTLLSDMIIESKKAKTKKGNNKKV